MSDVAEIEKHIEKLRETAARKELALKLEKNRDFRKLILEEFCTNECANYAQLSADPNMSAESRADCLGLAQAAGHLRRWLSVCIQMGTRAEDDIKRAETELEEARREEI